MGHQRRFLGQVQRKVKYQELKLVKFIAGYAQILLPKDISLLEWTECEKHLALLM